MLKTRIAPTPSGLLHAGNGASFLLTWLIAKAFNGSVLLRIDDLDSERLRDEYVEDIFASLDWLGIQPDEGPSGPLELHSRFSQKLRIPIYNSILDILRNKGLLFACSCTRSMLPSGPYPGTCEHKNIPLDSEDVAWRIRVPENTEVCFNDLLQGPLTIYPFNETGSFVVRSRTCKPAYQIASLCDDIDFNINFIVRGTDLIPSTAAQLYIDQTALNGTFSKTRFLHHPLLKDSDENKLSKSKGAASLQHMRLSGESPLAIYRIVAEWMNVSAGNSIEELKERLIEKIRESLSF